MYWQLILLLPSNQTHHFSFIRTKKRKNSKDLNLEENSNASFVYVFKLIFIYVNGKRLFLPFVFHTYLYFTYFLFWFYRT